MKARSRTTDMYVLEKSDCAVVPVNRPNKGRRLPAEVGEGRAQLEENIVPAHMFLTLSRNKHATASGRCAWSNRSLVLPSRHSFFRRAVCVNAHVRICAGGDQQ